MVRGTFHGATMFASVQGVADTLDVELSRFVADLTWADLPKPVRARVRELWADTVANALAGRAAASTPAVEELAMALAGPGTATIVGGGMASMTGAALVNGFQITAFTMCDVYRPALCHVTPEVVPAVLALGEHLGASGREVLSALAVGLEVTTRLGLSIDYPRFRSSGWHAPGVIGTVGAAAAGARLLRLDARSVQGAIGLGVSQASGTFAALGTAAVKFHQARGAVSGLWAALFAANGLGGARDALSHPDGGLLSTYAGGGSPELIVRDLGRRWELHNISLRRWPAASSLQSLVDVLLSVDAPSLGDIDRVEVALPDQAYALCGRMGWTDELTAMQSARFVTAAVLRDRRCWIDTFARSQRRDRELTSFARQRVTVRRDPQLPPSGCRVVVQPVGRPPVTIERDTAPGDPTAPLPPESIRDKLAAACAAAGAADVHRIEELVFNVERLADVRELTEALRVIGPTKQRPSVNQRQPVDERQPADERPPAGQRRSVRQRQPVAAP
jgi:2-methylcitrate dehydratase PrpD